ncbi:MAG: glycoside hydrolase family 95 protein, partial [Firmicutes bacterium]|nr:glycoside hydrolase family 95 protein [Bacillota bacterium]
MSASNITRKNLQTLAALGLALALPAALCWYYDVYVHWQPKLYPFAVIAVILGNFLLTLLVLQTRGEKAKALVWKTQLSVLIFMAALFIPSSIINNVMHKGAALAANAAVSLCAAQLLALYTLVLHRTRRKLLGFGLLGAMLLAIFLYFGGPQTVERTLTPPPDTALEKPYMLWYNAPAPNRYMYGEPRKEGDWSWPGDPDWEQWSLPLGNGHFGVNVFGRTDTERLQITEASLGNPYPDGMNNFAEVLIDFDHPEQRTRNYTRDLVLDDATAHVKYEYQGVSYEREYLTSYPDAVLAVRLSASENGRVSFTLRPEIPYLKEGKLGKSGTVTARGDTITLAGEMEHYGILFECQISVLHEGGALHADNGALTLEGADSAVILMALGTNYALDESVFLEPEPAKKLAGNARPHERVTNILENAAKLGYDELRARHVADYQALFSRVKLDLGGNLPKLPADRLLEKYKRGKHDPYLEALYFQFGRYLLIASSRQDTLPGNLQGLWNQYESAPWSAGYWHNINIQMNYWPAFTTNLAELFEPYADLNEAFRGQAQGHADDYLAQIREQNPDKTYAVPMAEPGTGQNGWAVGTGVWPYTAEGPAPGGHSGPGTGGLTSKLFWDWYDYTRDGALLEERVYPALSGMADFLSKTVIEQDGLLLAYPSASPEQLVNGEYYETTGCAFDQQMIYENHRDTIKAAEILGIEDEIVRRAKAQLDRLDPVITGDSGQVKEYREEGKYGDIVDEYQHRHISQLMGLVPGQTINSNTPEWLEAARVTLTERGDKSTGWAMALRLNAWARARDGEHAYLLYQNLLKNGTLPNLWDTHPPFQIDGNFGGTAGVAEMLLQSNGSLIEPLPALPEAWSTGSFEGLVARGNFVVDCAWEDGRLTRMTIEARAGGECSIKYPGIDGDSDEVVLNMAKGEAHTIHLKPRAAVGAIRWDAWYGGAAGGE